MGRLSGTGLIADDLYLLAHDDVSGRPFLQPRPLGVGLAGGLLAELIFAGAVRVGAGQVVLIRHARPADGLGRHVLWLLDGEWEQHPVRDWLMFLAANSGPNVACRLERAGYLTQVGSRRPRRASRLVPADPDYAFAPVGRVRAVLDPARTATVADAVLAGLAVACGLGSRLLPYGPPGARHCLDAAVRQLSPDLRELIAHVQAAADAAVLSHRK